MSVELFRYRGAARDGGTLEHVFESGDHVRPKTVTEKAAEVAADFMTTFYASSFAILRENRSST
jgi:hypothetical protein